MAAGREDLLEATEKVRQVREGITKKLDQYREQYEEMHIRALTAEMEAASVRMKLDSVLRDIKSHKSSIVELVDQLGIERLRNTETEASLSVAKEKITKVRTKLKIEFDKILANQKDLRLGVNSFMRCLHEYKSDAINQKDFFFATDLIFTSLLASEDNSPSSPFGSHDNMSHDKVLFSSDSLQDLVQLSPAQRRRKLELIIDRLSPEILFSPSSDSLLSFVFEDSAHPLLPGKPPILPKPTRISGSKVVPPPRPPKPHPQIPPREGGKPIFTISDSDDSDFEGNEEIQRIRSTNRIMSSPSLQQLGVNKPSDKNTRTTTNGVKRRLPCRSKSCDNFLSDSRILSSGGSDADEYALPYQHLQAWRKMVNIRDSSILTGSLPRLNVMSAKREDTSACYVAPNEFRAFVCEVKEKGNKMGQRASVRVMKRVDSLLKSYCTSPSELSDQNHYLQLIGDDRKVSFKLQQLKGSIKTTHPSQSSPSLLKRPVPSRITYENHTLKNHAHNRHTPKKVVPGKQAEGKVNSLPSSGFNSTRSPQKPNSSANIVTATPISSTHPPIPMRVDPAPIPSVTSLQPSDNRFDDPVYEMNAHAIPDHTHLSSQQDTHAIIDYSTQPPMATRPLPPTKPHMVDIELRKRGSSVASDNDRPPALLPRPNKPKPPPRPRIGKGEGPVIETTPIREIPISDTETSVGGFPDTIPTYCTLKRSTHSLRLVPILHPGGTGHAHSDEEEEPGDYSMGTFQFVMNTSRSTGTLSGVVEESNGTNTSATGGIASTPKASSSSDSDSSDDYETPPDATQGYVEPRTEMEGGGRDRSYTATLIAGNKVIERQGYMHKLDPSMKRWTRRWFVLKGRELKYFSSAKSRKAKGVINLETWCKISRHEMTSSFQLATPSRTYQFVADSSTECDDWMKALQTIMRVCQGASVSHHSQDILSGWVKLGLKDSNDLLKCRVSIIDHMLHVYHTPKDPKPLYVFDLLDAMIRHGTSFSHFPQCPSGSLPFCNKEDHTILIELGGAGVNPSENKEVRLTLVLSAKEEEELWFYHLVSASSGEEGPEITLTERLITRLWRAHLEATEGGGVEDEHAAALWTNPLLNYTSEPIKEALLSHPSSSQGNEAVELFKMVNLFIITPFDSLGMDYHIMSLQQLVSKCLSSHTLRDEIFCQILRQISAVPPSNRPHPPAPDRPHSPPTLSPSNVLQGWFLLALLIPLFLPTRRVFRWYLETVLQLISKPHPHSSRQQGVLDAAHTCYQRFVRAEKKGPREKTPSWFELQYLMSGPAMHVSRFMLTLKLKLPVKLMNDTTLTMEFDSSTVVQEFISQLNQEIGMPDSETTGFALMSDWPGEDDEAGFYLFPSNKLCDVISTWSECLSEYSSTNSHTRHIQLTYRKRLHFQSRRGQESDKEALLLTYQISKDVLNEYYYVGNVELAVDITARMAQIDFGDCEGVEEQQQEQIVRDAIMRFCPMKFTKMILPHDMEVMVDRLLNRWKGNQGMNKHTCARMLLSLYANNWELYGSTLFYCTDQYSILTSVKNAAVWLAVHENGITLLNANYLVKPIVSFTYKEVATFGGHCNDFMLVVNSCRTSHSLSTPTLFGSQSNINPVHTEKILLSMSKLKIREATYLMASYLDVYSNTSRY